MELNVKRTIHDTGIANMKDSHSLGIARFESLNITNSNEMFIFSRINRTAKPKEKNSGSSTHQSSSGTTHGGGGGKF